MGRLSGKVAIITGAAGGQGEAEARLFVAEGARVAITDIQERGQHVAAELGDAAFFLHHDVSDSAAWTRVVSETLRRFGKLDALVNNAAMFNPKTLVDTSAAELEQHFRVNQLGVFLGMKAVIEPLQAAKGGSIVNISSVSAMRAIPGQFAYAASKWAVRGMTGNAAFELARVGIRVNAVYPGLHQHADDRGKLRRDQRPLYPVHPVGSHRRSKRSGGTCRLSRLGRGKLHQRRRDRGRRRWAPVSESGKRGEGHCHNPRPLRHRLISVRRATRGKMPPMRPPTEER